MQTEECYVKANAICISTLAGNGKLLLPLFFQEYRNTIRDYSEPVAPNCTFMSRPVFEMVSSCTSWNNSCTTRCMKANKYKRESAKVLKSRIYRISCPHVCVCTSNMCMHICIYTKLVNNAA